MKDAKTTLNAKNMTSATLTIIGKLGGEMFKNMKIPVENNLDEIVEALKIKGYMQEGVGIITEKWIITSEVGLYIGVNKLTGHKGLVETTLAELKEM